METNIVGFQVRVTLPNPKTDLIFSSSCFERNNPGNNTSVLQWPFKIAWLVTRVPDGFWWKPGSKNIVSSPKNSYQQSHNANADIGNARFLNVNQIFAVQRMRARIRSLTTQSRPRAGKVLSSYHRAVPFHIGKVCGNWGIAGSSSEILTECVVFVLVPRIPPHTSNPIFSVTSWSLERSPLQLRPEHALQPVFAVSFVLIDDGLLFPTKFVVGCCGADPRNREDTPDCSLVQGP